MKFLHISDLHLGKVVHGVSMLENGDQPWWIERFIELADRVRPQAVVIAGDVYDRRSPSEEAVELLGRFLEALSKRGIAVMLIAGNHDSGPRLAFLRNILAKNDIHIAGELSKELTCVPVSDEYGAVNFYLMPYVFPALAAQVLEDDGINDYDTAVRRILAEQHVDTSVRNVIVAHQNVTANGVEAVRGGSESMIGTVGPVEYTAFGAFDYAALGHIHGANPKGQGRDTVRYAGSPICYHFNETNQGEKGALLVTMGEKGSEVTVETIPIPPLHPMREIRGELDVIRHTEAARTTRGEYLGLVVTDRPITPEIAGFFQELAEKRDSILMKRESEYQHTNGPAALPGSGALEEKLVEELFYDFYEQLCGGEIPSKKDRELMTAAGELLRNNPPNPDKPNEVDPRLADKLLETLLAQEVNEE